MFEFAKQSTLKTYSEKNSEIGKVYIVSLLKKIGYFKSILNLNRNNAVDHRIAKKHF